MSFIDIIKKDNEKQETGGMGFKRWPPTTHACDVALSFTHRISIANISSNKNIISISGSQNTVMYFM